MAKLWHPYRIALPVVALLLVLATSVPIVSMHKDCRVSSACTASATPGTTCKSSDKTTAVVAAKEAAKPRQKKSVFDADALERPISFFKDLVSADGNNEEERDIAPQADTLVLAVKALAATLLSTII
ncbi:hypothetical protein [Botryobacter ruber]|uniref:hypothetical protein n=1 Tax=Botryobacter ruber TaxID=2171629 RepID=UPI000F64D4E8|nr:hypothetical protein [Botryobacter ruber]